MRLFAATAIALAPALALAQHDHSGMEVTAVPSSVTAMPAAAAPVPRDVRLPPADDQAKEQLEKSPRHGEWADVKVPGGTPVRTWIVYPERKDRAGVVLLIHDVGGESDWIRAMADQVAREGFIAVAPDLISGHGPKGGGTESAGGRDAATRLVRDLTPEETVARLNAVRDWATKLPSANGKSATVGFCWGGTQSFAYAAAQPALTAAVVYYGTPPDSMQLAKIAAPVAGFYGGDDARVTSTVAPTQAEMKKLQKSFEANVYDGAGHGFLRNQDQREGANRKAVQKAWPRTIAFLKERLG